VRIPDRKLAKHKAADDRRWAEMVDAGAVAQLTDDGHYTAASYRLVQSPAVRGTALGNRARVSTR
jgi:hypothetical protein